MYHTAAKIVIMQLEGGDKIITDSGGLTKYGVSQRAYPELDIVSLTYSQAVGIFKKDYWDKVKGDQLPFPLNIHMADAAYNMGPVTAIKLLQKAIGCVAVDGLLGRKTLARCDRKELDVEFNTRRVMSYQGMRGFNKYGVGWLNRVFRLHNILTAMAFESCCNRSYE